jgi:hypothetical protein
VAEDRGALGESGAAAGRERAWVWMVLQGAGWSGVIGRDAATGAWTPSAMQPPTYLVRFMTYHAIMHGAQGLLYFGMNVGLHPDTQPLGWDWGYWRHAVAPVVRELRSGPLAEALAVAGHSPDGLVRRGSIHARSLAMPAGGAVRIETRAERRRGEPEELEGLPQWGVRVTQAGSPTA